MYLTILVVIHVFAGVIWAGSIISFSKFTAPAIGAAGPAGAKVMMQLLKGKMPKALFLYAIITLVSGFLLLAAVAGSGYMGSPRGITVSIGMLVGIIAFLIGVFVQRPNVMKLLGMLEEMEAADGPPSEELQGRMAAVRNKMKSVGGMLAGMLSLTVVLMAACRYIIW